MGHRWRESVSFQPGNLFGQDILDQSGYRRFFFPEHTILLAKATITLAPETTGFRTPLSPAHILYPDGALYEEPKKEIVAEVPVILEKPAENKEVVKSAVVTHPTPKVTPVSYEQTASVIGTLDSVATASPQAPMPSQEGSLWPWYIGAAFLGALALLGLRLTRDSEGQKTQNASLSADDFEIIEEETDDEEPH